jgi:hypothetical protein
MNQNGPHYQLPHKTTQNGLGNTFINNNINKQQQQPLPLVVFIATLVTIIVMETDVQWMMVMKLLLIR